MWEGRVTQHGANGGHTRYWLVFWSMPLLYFFKVSLTNSCISVFPVMWNPSISIDWFTYINPNSVQIFVAFIFLFCVIVIFWCGKMCFSWKWTRALYYRMLKLGVFFYDEVKLLKRHRNGGTTLLHIAAVTVAATVAVLLIFPSVFWHCRLIQWGDVRILRGNGTKGADSPLICRWWLAVMYRVILPTDSDSGEHRQAFS